MKKLKTAASLFLTLGFAVFLLAACGGAPASTQTEKEIKVGFSAGPYENMFKKGIAPSLEEKGYKVDYVVFSDYVQPNNALANREIDVNMFQHSVYLENFKTEHNLDLVYITEIPTAGMGIFSNSFDSIDAIPDGATVAIPNDPTNLTRSLKVLEQTGLVKIDPSADPAKANEKNLSENPRNLTFIQIEAPQLPRSLDSADVAVINGNYAISAGLKLSEAIYNEELKDGYINVIALRTEDKDSRLVQDILEIVKSRAFKDVIEDPEGEFSSFQKPKDY